MLFGEAKIVDFMIGVVIFGSALLYLFAQYRTNEYFNNVLEDQVLEQKNLYQQTSDVTINLISDEEMKSIIMGYREYPIVLEGTMITTDDMDFDKNLLLIKDDLYIKSYKCNTDNEIIQIIYNSTGS